MLYFFYCIKKICVKKYRVKYWVSQMISKSKNSLGLLRAPDSVKVNYAVVWRK